MAPRGVDRLMGQLKINRSRAQLSRLFGARARHLTERRAEEIMDASQEECPVGDREYTDADGDHPGALYRSHRVVEDHQPGIFAGFKMEITASYTTHVIHGEGPEGPRLPNRFPTRALDRVAARHRG